MNAPTARAVKSGNWLTPRWPALMLLMPLLLLPWILPTAWPGLANGIFDLYQRLHPRPLERLPVVIIDIDEASLKAIGQWPWPRTELAALVEKAAAAGALAIGLDILMPEADRYSPAQLVARYPGLDVDMRSQLAALPNNDDLFAIRMFTLPVVVGRAGLNDPMAQPPDKPSTVQINGPPPHNHLLSFSGHLANVESIDIAAQGHGFLNNQPGPDGAIRTVPAVVRVGAEIYPSLSVEVLRVALGQQNMRLDSDADGVVGMHIGQSFLPLDANGKVRLHFSPSDPRRWVSALDVLEDKISDKDFADQVVLIGATGLGLHDTPPTPVSAAMDGIEIQAQMIENLLGEHRLVRPPWARWAEAGLLLLLGGFLVLAGRDATPWRLAAIYVVPAALTLGLFIALFVRDRLLLDPSPVLLGNGLLTAFLISTGYSHANRLKRALDRALAREKLETARMGGELNAAREIQLGILPDPKDIAGCPDNLDFHAVLEPAREVGGDLYDAFMVDDRQLFFLIGDVSGKGVGASLFMALSKALCRSAALRGDGGLAEMISVASGEIARENPAMLFVTAVAGLLDTTTGRLQYCNAGHDAPLLLGPDQPARSLESAGGPPLCVLEDFPYPIEEAQLNSGDLLVLFTDGVTEARGGDQVLFGADRISTYLQGLERNAAAEVVCTGLLQAVNHFTGDAPAFDDVAIMALRWRPAP
ncbi:MAG: CHASE2 domain-containing protein [Alphaproteobacteria bacterium]|nr:CHASE2 domain-containing protein [Alphaproteobacteria bacterium]